jgi:Spy/CpxP family protein refolding chaperone
MAARGGCEFSPGFGIEEIVTMRISGKNVLTLGGIVLILGLAALLGGPAQAQKEGSVAPKERGSFPPTQRGRGLGMGGGGLGLLTNRSVQEELKLSDEQAEKVRQVASEVREKHQDDIEKLQDLQGPERREKAQVVMRAVAEESRKALDGVLTPEQAKRLRQITLQVRGTEAFSDPTVQERLNLTDDQKEKLSNIGEDARKEMREIFESAGEDRAEAGQKLRDLRQESLKKVTAVLTVDQKETWKELTGDPFQIRIQQPDNERAAPKRTQKPPGGR